LESWLHDPSEESLKFSPSWSGQPPFGKCDD
jgi:hypothetical protein